MEEMVTFEARHWLTACEVVLAYGALSIGTLIPSYCMLLSPLSPSFGKAIICSLHASLHGLMNALKVSEEHPVGCTKSSVISVINMYSDAFCLIHAAGWVICWNRVPSIVSIPV